MIINQIIATTNETELPFTVDNLIDLAKTAIGKPVLMDFDSNKQIGIIDHAEVIDNKLKIKSSDIDIDVNGLYAVPGYTYPEYKLISVGITDKPVDITLSKIGEED